MKNGHASERHLIAAKEQKKEEAYWLKKLAGEPGKTGFPYDFKKLHKNKHKQPSTCLEFLLPADLSAMLMKLSTGSDPRLHIILTAGLMLLLSKYTNSNDIIVGTPIYKQNTAGEFVNTLLPLRNQIHHPMTFKELLLEVRQTVSEAVENQGYPVEILVDQLNIPRSNSDHDFPLADTALLLENIQDRNYTRHINFNTVFSFLRTDNVIEGVLEYNPQRYRATTIERIISHFDILLRQVLSNPGLEIADIDILSQKEKMQLLVEFNDTAAEFPQEKTIHQLFEEQAAKIPHHTAVVLEKEWLTYGELNKRANRLARILRKKRVGPDTITAVWLERSLEMIAVLLGVLKAGSSYLPIDTDLPLKRLISILEDSRVPVLLTETGILETHTFTAVQTLRSTPVALHVTAPRPQILDFNSIPIPDRSLVDYEKYNRFIGQASLKHCISLQATRGCPYKCVYCHKIWPKKHVVRSAQHIFAEIRLLYDMGVRRFALIDDIFNLNKKNSTTFFQLIIDNGLDLRLSFPNGVRGDILSHEYIDLMVEAGVREIALALETASPRLQKLIRKNLNLEKFRQNIEYFCEKYPHVIIRLYTMLGFPSETEAEAMQTLNFIKSLQWLHFPYVFILKIYPNTDMAKLAMENGVPEEAITRSLNLAYHELPDTLPFEKSFALKYQADFFNNYFLNKERLLHILPYQFRLFTGDELVMSYNAYLPNDVYSSAELLDFFGISRQEAELNSCLDDDHMEVQGFNTKLLNHFKPKTPDPDAIKVLLLDLSMVFSTKKDSFAVTNEPPLGLLYLLSYLYHQQGSKICGKIGKTRMDFDNYEELKTFIAEFNPDIIGIRTLSMYREFFHKTVALIRQWGIDVPIVTGGPYATSSFRTILQDRNIDVVALGEGEITFNELIEKTRENNKKLPAQEVLKNIKGIAFNPATINARKMPHRQTLLLDQLTAQLSPEPDKNLTAVNLENLNQPTDLAYTIFTSGTTGKPKGVMIEHRNVVRLMFNNRYLFDFNNRDVWTMCHPYNFDFSVWEMYGALLYGGRLVIIPKLTLIDPGAFLNIVEKEKVTVLNQTPSAFFNITGKLNAQRKRLKIKYLIFGGEALMPLKLKEWHEMYSHVKIINMFGITETTVHVTFKDIGSTEISLNMSNVGKPIPTLTVYIMDGNLRLTPLGVAGEICVGGAGLARGYLNRPQLTAEKFVQNPYNPDEKLYRSGDLGRMSTHGEIEYLGRIDHQVKIRGFRIELEEIENHLLKHPGLAEAIVLLDRERSSNGQERDKYLTAYVIPQPGSEVDTAKLREYLSAELPPYMLPHYFVKLAKIPLTVTGKVNRRVLSEIAVMDTDLKEEYAAPQNPIEEKLAEIWAAVLGRERVGTTDNFFNIGGDSIKSIRIASRMKEAGYNFDMKDLFNFPTIRELAPQVKIKEAGKTKPEVEQEVVTGFVPLTPIQHEFFEKARTHPHHFNHAMMFSSKEGFDEEAIKAVLEKLQHHHDALRMTFKNENGAVIQQNHGLEYPVSLQVVDLRGRDKPLAAMIALANDLQAGIRLSTGPLLKSALFHLDDGDRLLLVIHHLVVDGVSWRILFEDIDTLYRQYTSKKPLTLPPKTASVKHWAEQLCQYANSHSFLQEKPYWRHLESQPVAEITTDFPAHDNFIKDIKQLSYQLTREQTQLLLTRVNNAYGTEMNDILLTALALAFYKIFGHKRLLIALEGHGREDILKDMDIHRTIGWFTTVYPVLLDCSYEQDLARQVKEIKETLRRIPNKGIGYGILKYLTAAEHKKSMNFTLKPQISFNYLGQFGTDLEDKSFEAAGESTGQNVSGEMEREFQLEVSGIIARKQLTMSVIYNKKHFKPATIEALLSAYQSQLIRIINHCASKEKSELTPADFTYPGLPIPLVDRLTSQFQIEDIYRLTPLQEGILFHSLYDSSGAYFVQNSYRVSGRLHPPAVKKSLDVLLKRYEILRTIFIHEDIDQPVQVVLKNREVDFYFQDISEEGDNPVKNKEAFLNEYKVRDRQRYFDLSRDVLIRLAVFRLAKEEYQLIWTHHHILMDGWCSGVLISECFKIYDSLRENKPLLLPEVTPYRTYIQWLGKQDKEAMKNYWRKYLDSYQEAVTVPGKKPGEMEHKGIAYKLVQERVWLDREKTLRLNEIAAHNHVTINTITQTVWGILLGKYNSKEDVVFGSVVSGRPYELEGVETMVGLFINTIPVRIHFRGKTRFNQLLKQVQEDAVNARSFHYFPLAENQSESILKQDLINHVFVFENYPIAPTSKVVEGTPGKPGKENLLTVSNTGAFAQTNYDFNLILDAVEHLNICFKYNGNAYDSNFVKQIGSHFIQVLHQVTADPDIKIAKVEILPADKKKEMLHRFNENLEDKSLVGTIQDLLFASLGKNSHRTAIDCSTGKSLLTYSELLRKSVYIANWITTNQIERGSHIGIFTQNRSQLITMITGILRASCVFVPLDPLLPDRAIASRIEIANTRMVFTDAVSQKRLLSFFNDDTIVVDDLFYRKNESFYSWKNPLPYNREDPVYIYFTSGSTGIPKAILGNNKGLLHFIRWEIDTFGITRGFKFSQLTNPGFDVFLRDIFVPLCAGGTICIPTENIQSNRELLIQWINRLGIQLIHMVPSLFKVIVSGNLDTDYFHSLKYILLAGEKINPVYLKKWYDVFAQKTQLVNIYGPTETTLAKAFYFIKQDDINQERIPIGLPINGARFILLDKDMNICDQGISGEIYIRTPYRSAGYYNDPELNKKRFVPNSFKDDKDGGDLIYRTGDLGRKLPDGNFEIIGRLDRQVKIRGIRIELESIENCLLKHEKIDQAVVINRAYKNGENYLCAYIIAKRADDTPDTAALRDFLSAEFPGYMIPSYFVTIENVPLAANGKIDLDALPEVKIGSGTEYVAPQNEIERKLADIWWEILAADASPATQLHTSHLPTAIGIDDNFFQLGGHSLKAMILISKLHKEFNVRISLADVFKKPYIRELARYIKNAVKDKFVSLEPVEKKEYYALSSAQQRLYFLHQLDIKSTVYNIPLVLALGKDIDKDKLESTLRKLITRHENFRTSFLPVNETPVQRVQDDVDFKMEYYLATEATGFVRPFDLAQAPLMRSGLIKHPDGNHTWLVDMHHIISDRTSSMILRQDFMALYSNAEETIPLAQLRLHYKDFAVWQISDKQKELLKQQELFWINAFSDQLPVLDFPTDYPRPLIQSFEGRKVNFILTERESQSLRHITKETGVTLYMLILSVITVLLSKLSGQQDIIVGTPVAARRHADLERIIGMFVNTLAIRNYPAGEKRFNQFLLEVKNRTLKVFENQEYQFEDVVEKVSVRRDTSRNPIFDVMFDLLSPGDFSKPDPDLDEPPGFERKHYQHDESTSMFDLCLTAVDSGKRLFFNLEYCSRLFKPGTIERIIGYFKKIISLLPGNTAIKLSGIEIISESEKQQILFDFNNTKKPYPQDKTIHQLLEEQAEQHPDSTAIIGMAQGAGSRAMGNPGGYITYRQLNETSNQLAYLLIEKGIQPNAIAAILMERSVEMIFGILGILKAGAAYLPIDPTYPEQRSDYILKDSCAAILLTTPALSEKFKKLPIVNCQPKAVPHTVYPTHPLTHSPTQLSYIIYTSGTTGNPKGVMISHRSVVNRLYWITKEYRFNKNDVFLQKTPFTFDVSVCESFRWILPGGTLCFLPKEGEKELAVMIETITKHKVTTIEFVPSQFQVLLEYIKEDEMINKFRYLRRIFIGGEVLSPGLVEGFNKTFGRYDNTRLINAYGPTEATVDVTTFDCSGVEGLRTVPIGKPMDNVQIFILGKENQLQPIGVPGQLCISGVSLARGYLNNPGLTAEKFKKAVISHSSLVIGSSSKSNDSSYKVSPNDQCPMTNDRSSQYRNPTLPHHPNSPSPQFPIIPLPHSPIYLTGDLARWRQDGNIEFLGRIDYQVKIRGFRIETGEIENQLLLHQAIKEAVVVPGQNKNSDKYLCAYIVAGRSGKAQDAGRGDDAPGIDALRIYLSKILPGYMIPSYFVFLDTLPLTPGGNIDRKALPEPGVTPEENYVAPTNTIEEKFVEIWSDVLGIEKTDISIENNFFELGGHSLNATMMAAKVYKAFNHSLPLTEIFKTPFIKELAQYIKNQQRLGRASKFINENLVVIKEKGDKADNLFFIHEPSGQVEAYVELCTYLTGKNCLGIRADMNEKAIPGALTMEYLAGKYIDIIKSFQPHGPYHLAGWSLAGNLAIEITGHLEKMNDEVKFLGIIDSPAPRPNQKKRKYHYTLENEISWLKRWLRIAKVEKYAAREIKKKMRQITDAHQMFPTLFDYFESKGNIIGLKLFKSFFSQYALQQLPGSDKMSIRELGQYFILLRNLEFGLGRGIPTKKINAPAYLFISHSAHRHTIKRWRNYCLGPIKSYKIDGDHDSIMQKPRVEEIAKIINSHFQPT